MARVNKQFIKHKLIVGLDDRGRISCHKVHLCFIYFDPNECTVNKSKLNGGFIIYMHVCFGCLHDI
jgi:hypothetical protein